MKAHPLAKQEIGLANGKPGPGRGQKTGANSTRLPHGSTQASYLARKLHRDHPDVFARRVARAPLFREDAPIDSAERRSGRCGHMVISFSSTRKSLPHTNCRVDATRATDRDVANRLVARVRWLQAHRPAALYVLDAMLAHANLMATK